MTPFLRCSIASLLFPMASMPGVFAQDEARGFKPMWKVGDSRTTTTTRQAQEVKYGLVEEDTTYMTSSTIEVAGMDPNAYALEVRYTNVALQAVAAFYDGLGEELKAYQDLVLAYHADKKTGAAELQNWKEAQAFMDRSFIAISRVMEKQGPEASRTAERAFAPLKSVFASKESIEAFTNAGREELAAAERAELAVIQEFLPKLADEAKTLEWVEAAIAQTGAMGGKDVGKVMGALMKAHKGEIDGDLARRLVQERLG